jgi:hypothetical protein
VTTAAQVPHDTVRAAAVPAAFGSVVGGPVVDKSLVLVGSDTQAASEQQGIDQAGAIRAQMGLAPLSASVVVSPSEQQGTDAADAIRAALGLSPLEISGERYATTIDDETMLRDSMGLVPLTLVDLR